MTLKSMNIRYVFPKVIGVACILTLSGCLLELDNTTVVADPSQGMFNPKRTICDPFETNSPKARDRGLIGNLLYLSVDQPRYNNVSDYINNAKIADATIYLNRLNIPARPFDRHFQLQTGELATTINPNELYEYFGLRMKGQLQLAEHEQPGKYQLAVLADEGALLKIPDGLGGEKIIVNNDGKHPTQFMCSSEPVYLDRSTKIPMTLEYYHGPGLHVSMIAMWRPWPDGVNNLNPVNDPMCGQHGNGRFFDSSVSPAVPKKAFYEMLERKWKVLENENFFFPEQADNPCAPVEQALAIKNFSVSEIYRDNAVLFWSTTVPANSLGEAKNVSSSAVIRSPQGEPLVQDHRVVISGLTPNTLYTFTAISKSPGGQTAVSDILVFRTGR